MIGRVERLGRLPFSVRRRALWHKILTNWVLYLFLLPCLAYIVIFNYIPLIGIQIAFRDFKASQGIWGSAWVGLKHFRTFFDSYQFGTLLSNTLTLSIYQIAASFPLPILLAIILNYTTIPGMKRFSQTVTYAPHLISTVVLCGMLIIFSSANGLFNQITGLFGMRPFEMLGRSNLYQSIYVWSTVWQRTGYSAVLYIAALSAVSDELHEAAIIDGANKIQRVCHIDFPTILPTVAILLIMNVGNLLSIGFEKSYLLQNSLNLGRSEIISTYVYKVGLQSGQFSYSTAISIFNNVINFTLLIAVNKLSGKLTGSSLW